MLAGKFDPKVNKPPFAVQPKIDGYRCLIHNGVALSRTLKPIPNRHIQSFFNDNAGWLEGFDGELTAGDPKNPRVFAGGGALRAFDGKPDFVFNAFDLWDQPNATFFERYQQLQSLMTDKMQQLRLVETISIRDMEQLDAVETEFVAQGYEGAIIRSHNGLYKNGRATTNQGQLLKLKRYEDDEATIVGFEELLSNQNEAKISKLGLTERSTHKANKVPMNTLGALIVKNPKWGEFNIGSGFDQALRQEIWNNRPTWLGKLVTFKYQGVGGYEKPRCPIFKGVRNLIDVGELK